MSALGIYQILFYFVVVLALTKPVGLFMSRLFEGERTFLHPLLRPVERLFYRLSGVREDVEQHWTAYAGVVPRVQRRSQFVFGLRDHAPAGLAAAESTWDSARARAVERDAMTADLAFNTAASFMTNTNWQSYVGETTMSYFMQMAALAVQNFVSAAAGIAIAIALIRGFARQETEDHRQLLGRSHAGDASTSCCRSRSSRRCCSRSQGVIQNFHPYTQATTVEGATQTIAQGPVASQEAIKELGTNGGGFFNANSAHPFENPNPLHEPRSDRADLRASAPGSPTRSATWSKDTRQGWALFCGDERDVPGGRLRRVLRPSRPAIPILSSWHRDRRRPPTSPAATWRARRRGSASRSRRCSRR